MLQILTTICRATNQREKGSNDFLELNEFFYNLSTKLGKRLFLQSSKMLHLLLLIKIENVLKILAYSLYLQLYLEVTENNLFSHPKKLNVLAHANYFRMRNDRVIGARRIVSLCDLLASLSTFGCAFVTKPLNNRICLRSSVFPPLVKFSSPSIKGQTTDFDGFCYFFVV